MDRQWSTQQQDIFNWFGKTPEASPNDNLVVVALAGTGKTTTIIEGINHAPEQRILLAAFNKRIAEELVSRIANPRAQAKTLHSVGYACIRRFRNNIKVQGRLNSNQISRADALSMKVCGPNAPDSVVRLVSKLHTKGREIVPHARTFDDLIDIAVNFECEPDEQWQNTNFNTNFVVASALAAMELASQIKSGEEIDFADMIYLPVRNHWLTKQHDLVVVDEAQDMTTAQLEIAEGVCDGRICIVGDPNQAIYGFRGADSNSISRLKAKLNATELGLTMTYRCGRLIVERAQELVPDFNYHESNPDGEILELPSSKLVETAQPGDFIVSRINAPLVGTALSLLRAGKRARIAGRDIGGGLKTLMRKLAKGRAANSVPEFLERVTLWGEREAARLTAAKQEARIDTINDQVSMFVELAEGVKSVNEIAERIDSLFTDDGLGQAGVITCSSVHKVKGLEANRVFVLWGTMRKHSQEELNIQYVAITRAKNTLFMVGGI